MLINKFNQICEYFLIKFNIIFICLFLLPISFTFGLFLNIRNWLIFKINSAPKFHNIKVKHIQKQIEIWKKNGRKRKLCTDRSGWQTMSFRWPIYKNSMYQIPINLIDILEINEDKQIVRVEPLVTIGQLMSVLIPLGWTLPIVPELDDLTIGGLVMGGGIETSSIRYGLFQNICLSFELVLCSGNIIKCSPKENPDLFYTIPWSYGTLGFLTSVELQMKPAKKYVKVTYRPVTSMDTFLKKFRNFSNTFRYDFVEAIQFDRNNFMIITGNFSTEGEFFKVNPIGRWYKPWFFLHVRDILNGKKSVVEYIPLRDYYHRHTKSIFWELQNIIPFGNNSIFRLLFGWIVPPKVSILKLFQTKTTKRLYENNHIIQDYLVPMNKLEETLDEIENIFNAYPLWICPFKLQNNPGFVHPPKQYVNKLVAPIYVDVGVYGVPNVKNFAPKETLKKMEKFLLSINGYQLLYTDTYMSKEEFRMMFDHNLYDKLRKELKCDCGFVEVYDKINRNARD